MSSTVDEASRTSPDAPPKDLKQPSSSPPPASQTATDYINAQIALEADAREALPYAFDTCTYPLGSLRQPVFACLTCTPPPASPSQSFTPAGVCYSCSISCHGEHTLVELFAKRNFICDCGTTRFINQARCTLRADATTGDKGVHSQPAAEGNRYNQNFLGKFCGCGEDYDPHTEKGTMFQCLGLGTVETGGCGEDWWHPECVVGLSRDWAKNLKNEKNVNKQAEFENTTMTESEKHEDSGDAGDNDRTSHPEGDEEPPVPPGFPEEDDFDTFICHKCVQSNPWIKAYAGTEGFLPPVFHRPMDKTAANGHDPNVHAADPVSNIEVPQSTFSAKVETEHTETQPSYSGTAQKRKASPTAEDEPSASPSKRIKGDLTSGEDTASQQPKHALLPSPAPTGILSVFCTSDFRNSFCHCPTCFPHLSPHPQLREEEETYSPPLSSGSRSSPAPDGAHSEGSRSLYDRGEAALNTVDRVRAIEGVMAYNHLKDKVKQFLRPYAESGVPVGAEDVKAYFEKLRDAEAGKKAEEVAGEGAEGDGRREQSGY